MKSDFRNGKGDKRRKRQVPKAEYDSNFDAVFGSAGLESRAARKMITSTIAIACMFCGAKAHESCTLDCIQRGG